MLGDRPTIALATAALARSIGFFGGDPDKVQAVVEAGWEEFSDLEETPAGVALMFELAGSTMLSDDAAANAWLERLLVVAERLNLLPETAAALGRLSSIRFRTSRPREALILLRGAHELAVANGIVDVDRNTRTTLTFYEQFADPAAGLAMAREGLEIASRLGNLGYGFMMVGNAVSCAIRVGEWAWAAELVDEWLANEITGAFYLELYVDRAILTALTGGDPSGDLAEAERLAPEMKDSQYESYCHLGRAWQAFAAGRFEDASRGAVMAADVTDYFVPISLPVAVRAELWLGRAEAVRELAGRLGRHVSRGRAVALDHLTFEAGIAALEGRRADAVAAYREALRGWRQLGLAFDEAMAALDVALLLAPSEREMTEAPAAITAARETLGRLGARPFLARLDAAAAAVPVQA